MGRHRACANLRNARFAVWLTFVASALMYCTYLGALIVPKTVPVCIGAALLGFGGAVLWTGQGTYLSSNSSDESRGDAAGLFWAIFRYSLIARVCVL